MELANKFKVDQTRQHPRDSSEIGPGLVRPGSRPVVPAEVAFSGVVRASSEQRSSARTKLVKDSRWTAARRVQGYV